MAKTIIATFSSRPDADLALRQIEQEGITKDQVTLLVNQEARARHFGFVDNTKSSEAAVTGATIGGLVGALYLGLISAGTLVVPGLNLVAAGTLLGTLAGLGAGGVTGGLIGALVGLGIPEHEAKLYEEGLKGGSILLAVHITSDDQNLADRVRNIMEAAQARNISTTSMAA